MKLPALLAEFLYERRRLALPGIGIFYIDTASDSPPDSAKKDRPFIPSIHFENAEIANPDEDLIDFIKNNTGKIRPLAIADLDSYLTLCKQMANIGRPFFLEGMGTISKNKDGKFDFVSGKDDIAGAPAAELLESEHLKRQSMFDKDHEFYKMQRNTGKRIALTVAVVAGLAVVGWGGYKLYEKNSIPEPTETTQVTPVDTASTTPDTAQVSRVAKDSVTSKPAKLEVQAVERVKTDSLPFKFVILQTYDKSKALKRYNQLLSYLLKIKMQTTDSSFFKLYFTFPAIPRDTLRIKDSLNLVYATHTIIEPAMSN